MELSTAMDSEWSCQLSAINGEMTLGSDKSLVIFSGLEIKQSSRAYSIPIGAFRYDGLNVRRPLDLVESSQL